MATQTNSAESVTNTETISQGGDGGALDNNHFDKIDEITAIQDAIDGLSLAMFEALRGLRDAVAPESGNLANNNANNNNNGNDNPSSSGEPDFEEFVQNYRNGDPATIELVKKVGGGMNPTKREDFVRIHCRIEMEKDTELVTKLASTVLDKSQQIDERVSTLPGMNRTKSEQMSRIKKLLQLNQKASKDLEQAYDVAESKRNQVRQFIRDHTCEALGIVEERD